MTFKELDEHAGYLSDHQKLAAYEQALTLALARGGMSVLDLGAGTGILGLLAARAGARVVYAVDRGSVIGAASEVAAATPCAERIVHIRARSTDVVLPERVDVAVCDQIGGFVYDAGVLEYFADVRRRLLTTDGTLVPCRFRLYVAPAECGRVREQIDVWGSRPAGFDFSAFRDLAVNTEHRVDGEDVRRLGPPVLIAEFASDHVEPIKGGGPSEIAVSGRCDGLVGWFEAEMGGGVVLTNEPGCPTRVKRWCNLYPIVGGVPVNPGDTVTCSVDVRPLIPSMTWTFGLSGPGRPDHRERHSTLLGQFLSAEDLARTRNNTGEVT